MAGKKKPVVFPVPPEKKYGGTMYDERGKFGHMGKPQDAYTYDDIVELGEGLLSWMLEDETRVWAQRYFSEKLISKDKVAYLQQKYPQFKEYYSQAKALQEQRLIENPFWKKADGNFAKFILTNRHDDWKDKGAEALERNTDASLEIAKAIATQRNPVKE